MNTPRVAICIPTYEPNPHLLRRSIESALSQTMSDWRMVIHDDASEEDTEAIVKPYLSDARIRFVRSSRRLGIGGNWNATFLALAPTLPLFTAYLFQDDLWAPEYLERALQVSQEHPTAGLVAVMHHYELEHLDAHSHLYQIVEAERRHLFGSQFSQGKKLLLKWLGQGLHPNIIGEPSFVLIRSELLHKTPWNEHMMQCLDIDGWIRLLQQTDIAFVSEDSGIFLVHSAGASARNQGHGKGMMDRLTILRSLAKNSDREIAGAAWAATVRELPKMALKFMRRIGHLD